MRTTTLARRGGQVCCNGKNSLPFWHEIRKTTFLPPQFTAWLRGISTVSLWLLFDKFQYCNLYQTVWQHRKKSCNKSSCVLHCLGTWPYSRSIQNVYPPDLKPKSLDDGRFEGIQEIWVLWVMCLQLLLRPTSSMSKLETKKTSFLVGDLEVPWFMTNPQSDLNHRFLWCLFCSVPKKVNQLIVNSTMPCPAPQNISGFKQFNIDAWFRGGRCRMEDKRCLEISLTSAQPSWEHTEKQCAPMCS